MLCLMHTKLSACAGLLQYLLCTCAGLEESLSGVARRAPWAFAHLQARRAKGRRVLLLGASGAALEFWRLNLREGGS